MAKERVSVVQEPGPNEMRDPMMRAELRRASVWFGLAIAVALVVLLIQPLLLIFAGLVVASMLDGGARLIRRYLPMPRGLALLIVVCLVIAFIGGVIYLTGVEIAAQAEQLRVTLETQANRLSAWLTQLGVMPQAADLKGLAQQALGSVGRVTSFIGGALGALGSFFLVLVIGLFVAMEPRIYERGLQWMVPMESRGQFAITLTRMGRTMRILLAGRLAGMVFEGILTWILLSIAGVPMALLLGILTGILAFIPNIGAFISGVLMVAVGFSAGPTEGFWAIMIYFGVQTFDGYVLLPLVAKHTVDMPPALTVSSQILASTLFGFLGLALADPIVAMIKVALERKSEQAVEAGMGPDPQDDPQPVRPARPARAKPA
ncbi:AI-2E family transporter [Sphingomonas sp. MG17]|uniref:AI-2E family transporter n=1 Tax=Sphingomonas tagetis TaxID=2949092 RepID=A0A9X2KM79_9SPHN|nr:AI-2E family transporter [Sphingomonas tagetis]MCP3732309.1 AI-2E family transporter [Sphingomonas tagetis]